MFSINRVFYDFKTNNLAKNNKKFEFERQIYADKFLLQNRNKDKEINEQILALREKQKAIRAKLAQYKDYH